MNLNSGWCISGDRQSPEHQHTLCRRHHGIPSWRRHHGSYWWRHPWWRQGRPWGWSWGCRPWWSSAWIGAPGSWRLGLMMTLTCQCWSLDQSRTSSHWLPYTCSDKSHLGWNVHSRTIQLGWGRTYHKNGEKDRIKTDLFVNDGGEILGRSIDPLSSASETLETVESRP